MKKVVTWFSLLEVVLLFLAVGSASAGSATWAPFTAGGVADWNTASNWSPQTVPNGPSDIATFAHSFTTAVFLSGNLEVNGITFASSMFPSAYTFTVSPPPNGSPTLTISGAGITNHSGLTQHFVTSTGSGGTGVIFFFHSATAGSGTVFTTQTGSPNSGYIGFGDTSNAGQGTFINNGGTVAFEDTARAGNGTFTNNGGTANLEAGGAVNFLGNSTAENSVITNNGAAVNGAQGGSTIFDLSAHGGNATLIANGGKNGGGGGLIGFHDLSPGEMCRVKVFGNGALDVSGHLAPSADVGSIQGNGRIHLGNNELAVGGNNLSTTFSGLIDDAGGVSGSLAKNGTGKLMLSKASTYSGGTRINGGTLLVTNTTGSATGYGPVQVNIGTLGGTGIIGGPVTVGTGNISGATLIAGTSKSSPGTLIINSTLTFNSYSTYKCVLNRSTGKVSQVSAFGVIINANVPFNFADMGSGTLPIGTVFTVINNTSASPIHGTFSNLSNGLVLTSADGTKFKVNYSGGTGNDLTLKVVP